MSYNYLIWNSYISASHIKNRLHKQFICSIEIKKINNSFLKSFTIGFDDENYNEANFANKIANQIDLFSSDDEQDNEIILNVADWKSVDIR